MGYNSLGDIIDVYIYLSSVAMFHSYYNVEVEPKMIYNHWTLLGLLLIIGGAFTLDQDAASTEKRMGKVFFKSYSTRTVYSLSFLTSTTPYTCYFAPAAALLATCGGRKRRLITLPSDFLQGEDTSIDTLFSSINEKEIKTPAAQREPKIFFTLWSTTTSTQTVTTFLTNRAITMSIGLLCTFPGVVYNRC